MISRDSFEDRLRQALAEQERSAPEREGMIERLIAKPAASPRLHRTGRPSWSTPLLASAAVVVVAVAVTIVAAKTGSHRSATQHPPVLSTSSAPVPSPTPVTSRYSDAVLRDGDKVDVYADIVAVPGRAVRLCARLPVALDGGQSGQQQAPEYCPVGVDVVGVDLNRLYGRVDVSGAIEGQARIEGTFAHGTVTVTRQTVQPPARGVPLVPHDQPPCSAPAGGWPRSSAWDSIDHGEAIAPYMRAHPGVVVYYGFLRPSTTQVLMFVATSGDPAPVRAELTRTYGERLCVIKAPYTAAQISRVQHDMMQLQVPPYFVWAVGNGYDDHGQPNISVDLVYVTPDIAALAASQPPGIVTLKPWLAPVR